MSFYNYHALLEYLGISHGQFIILLIVLFLISSFIFFFYKLGFLTPIKFKEQALPLCVMVYRSYQGSYDSIQQSFNQMMQDTNTVFKFSDPFGMYYDNPKEMANPDDSRAIFGCIVSSAEHDKIKIFLSKYPQYKQAKISKNTQCIGTTYPFFNALSMILVITRVYPRLTEEVKRRKVKRSIGILEIYKIVQDNNQHIKILLPTENLEEFQLWYPPVGHSDALKETERPKEMKKQA